VLTILSVFSIAGGIILAVEIWKVSTLLALLYFDAGIIQAVLFFSVGQAIIYLKGIYENTAKF